MLNEHIWIEQFIFTYSEFTEKLLRQLLRSISKLNLRRSKNSAQGMKKSKWLVEIKTVEG